MIIISSITLGLLIIAVYLLIRLYIFAKETKTNFKLEKHDELYYQEVINLFQHTRHASATMLQARLRIGYAQAARIMEEMEARGVVGPAIDGKLREVLIDKDR